MSGNVQTTAPEDDARVTDLKSRAFQIESDIWHADRYIDSAAATFAEIEREDIGAGEVDNGILIRFELAFESLTSLRYNSVALSGGLMNFMMKHADPEYYGENGGMA